MWGVEWQNTNVSSHNKSISNYITRIKWKNNNERIKSKNPLLLITCPPHEERTLSYIHECHNDRSTIFSTTLNYFPIITRYDPFKSSTHLSHILDKICQPNLPWSSPWVLFQIFKVWRCNSNLRIGGVFWLCCNLQICLHTSSN